MTVKEELDKIIGVVAVHTGVQPSSIIGGSMRPHSFARGLVCHVIANGFPHLAAEMASRTSMVRSAFNGAVRRVGGVLAARADAASVMNDIRAALGMPPLPKEAVEEKRRSPSPTKMMFGFDYTSAERREMREAMRASAEYMAQASPGIHS